MQPIAVRRAHLRLVSDQPTVREVPTTRFDDVEAWAVWMRAQSNRPRTIKDRRDMAARFERRTGVPLLDATADDIIGFLSDERLAPGTRQTYYTALHAFYQFASATGRRADDPSLSVRRPRCPRRQPHPVTTAQLEQLLGTRMHRRTRTMILLAAYQGLRVHEVAKVRGDDVDTVSGLLRVVGKGGVDVTLPLHPLVAVEAASMPAVSWWFPSHTRHERPIAGKSVSAIIGQAMDRAGIPGSAHSLRHWYGTELLRAGANARVVQELLRHASLATTAIYTEVASSETARALGQLPIVAP